MAHNSESVNGTFGSDNNMSPNGNDDAENDSDYKEEESDHNAADDDDEAMILTASAPSKQVNTRTRA